MPLHVTGRIACALREVERRLFTCSRLGSFRSWANQTYGQSEHEIEKEFMTRCDDSYKKNFRLSGDTLWRGAEDDMWEWLKTQFGESQEVLEALEALSLLMQKSDNFVREWTKKEGCRWISSQDAEKQMALGIEKSNKDMKIVIDEFREREKAIMRNEKETNRWRSRSLEMMDCPHHTGSAQL